MTALATDLLVLWAAATAAGTGVLTVVVLGQGAVALTRRAVRRRPRDRSHPGSGVGPGRGPAAPR